MIRTTLLPLTMSMAIAAGLSPATSSGKQVPVQPGQPVPVQPGQPVPVQPGQPAQQPGQVQPGQPAQQPGQVQRAGQAQQAGQANEAQWLDALPADLPIVVRVGGMEQATNNLVSMMRAMSPQLAEQLGSQIQAVVSEFSRSLGAQQGQASAMVLIDVVTPDQLGQQIQLDGAQLQIKPRAIAVFQTNDYRGALTAISGRADAQPEQQDGFEVVTDANGQKIFATQKEGFAAVTQHEDLIRKISAGSERTLGQAIDDDLRSHFLDGDVGVYVDIASINETYADQGQQLRGFLSQQLRQLGEQNAEAAETLRMATQQAFETAENARAVAANASFAEQGLSVSGKLLMNEGFEPMQKIAAQGDDAAEELARLPRGSTYYAFNMLDPDMIEWSMIPSGDQIRDNFPEFAALIDSPEMEQAKQQFQQAGLMRTSASLGLGETRKGVCVIDAENAPALIEAVRSTVEAVKNREFALIRDLSCEQGAQEHQGYTFDKITVSYDFDAFTREIEEQAKEVKKEVQDRIDDEDVNRNIDQALADAPIDRNEAVVLLRRVAGESTTVWVGTDGTKTLSVLAETWEDALPQIDAYLSNDQGIGQTDSFQKVRGQLPDRVRSLTLVDVRAGVRQILAEARQATGDQSLRAPDEMPEGAAFVGNALVAESDGFRFQAFVPSEVGPVIERGVVPVIEEKVEQLQQNQDQ